MSQTIRGVGIGLRQPHLNYVLEHKPNVAWFEALSDNYLFLERPCALDPLLNIRERYPVVLHGVGLSLGSVDPLNELYLERLGALIDAIEPAWVSDHLCWVSTSGQYVHELMPLPYNEEAIEHVSKRIEHVQERLGRRVLIENVSSYLTYHNSELAEWTFLAEVAQRADCFILLDINNVYVSAFNHGFDPMEYLNAIPPHRVKQFHLAGYEAFATHLLDTHGAPVSKEVWELYEGALAHFGPVPTLIEWDNQIPEFSVLVEQAQCAQQRMRRYETVSQTTNVSESKYMAVL